MITKVVPSEICINRFTHHVLHHPHSSTLVRECFEPVLGLALRIDIPPCFSNLIVKECDGKKEESLSNYVEVPPASILGLEEI